MSVLLELIKEASPEELKQVAMQLKLYMSVEVDQSDQCELLSLPQFKRELCKLGINKRLDWLRNDLFVQLPELKNYIFNLNEGTGHHLKINRKAVDVVKQHYNEIDWRG